MIHFAKGKLFFSLLLLLFSSQILAQSITNGDGTPLTTQYCWKDENYEIKGQPVGGVFSGNGIFQHNGQWYFSPDSATKNITVFPVATTVTYTVNGTSAHVSLLVWKPVVFNSPQADSATCNGYFSLEAHMLYAGAYNYQWLPASPLVRSDTNVTSGFITQTQAFVIIAEDLTSGCTASDTIIINRSAIPEVKVASDTITILPRERVILNASGADYYQWFPRMWLDNDAVPDPVASPHTPITYAVVGTNSEGCSDTSRIVININEALMVPNAFSPNGDGVNDVFKIENIGYQGIEEFRVFNRWGVPVFETHDGTKGWDGNCKGQSAEIGTYYYQIRLQMGDNKEKIYKGAVTLLR